MTSLALGIDPGLATFGYALVELRPDALHVVKMGVFRTEKTGTKAHVFQADDNFRRARDLAGGLLEMLAPYIADVRIICAESMSHPMFVNKITGQRNVMASIVVQMGLAWGIVASLAEQWNIPVVQTSPQNLKKSVCGTQKATKKQIQETLDARFCGTPGAPEPLGDRYLKPNNVPKSYWEHPYDALAAVFALQHADAFRAVRGHVA